MSDGGGPFGFDIHLALLFDDIVAVYRPSAIVETGSYLGDTTAYLANAYPSLPVITCDVDPSHAGYTAARLRHADNVAVHHADSPTVVAEASREHAPAVYFLDAHWGEQWPLARELAELANGPGPAVAVIHDFDIGYPGFGYDVYDGVPCGPGILTGVPGLPDVYFTSNPEATYPLPCLQTGRRTGVGVIPIGLPAEPLAGIPRLRQHSRTATTSAVTS
ncbi:hypothetical protein GCM10023196_036650 [Actinoallomurus vinaceus]|uniref:Class I SAM-dependent methyltransferase n=1 Tax=Actinoallomurus vinaceus TaxID=1080074 RepID=A0ABP8UBW0_9ACTN